MIWYFVSASMKKNIYNKTNNLLKFSMKTLATSEKQLLFFQCTCPHCEHHNVMAKANKQEVILCSNRGCRKIIILDNYKEIA